MPQPNQKLANYFSSSQALTINLLLKDLTKTSIQVYLKWSMDGPGVRVASMDGYVPPSFITLQKGVIERLNGLSLQNDYFRNGLIEEQGLGGVIHCEQVCPKAFTLSAYRHWKQVQAVRFPISVRLILVLPRRCLR
ncbi:hypothetical protein [Dyadobacter sp. NIV53]|uniref:hypothetical protein n=1 Tax=Dyadobacter sp. NIV53 TaxID=2861765 RepID=UPI001C87DE49|nr:hypothetical protein [Dyadobacter sp. NIV53]